MSKSLRLIILVFALLDIALILIFMMKRKKSDTIQTAAVETETGIETADTSEGKEHEAVIIRQDNAFHDNDLLYDYDLYDMQYLYVTVVEGSESEGTNHTLKEVDSYINAPGMEKTTQYRANAIVKAGDAKGPLQGMLGYGKSTANATINVRGKSSTSYAQKSYKLELYKNEGFWNGQRTIALNKHPNDMTRFRNALYYKLMREVPSLISLRTYFVHLYICDNTASGDGSGEYKDYGLFTAVEQPNNRFLRNHGLNSGGNLYKAYEFEFYRYEDALKSQTDPDYDAKAFSQVLEPKADTCDHTKLLKMLDKLNDYSIPIESLLEEFFDLDNLLDYMAFNMLMVNPDSSAQNYYIYNPLNTEKWYLICWDGDAILQSFEDEYMNNPYKNGEWTKGIAMYSNNVLFRRIIMHKTYREMLTERVESYRQMFTEEKLRTEIIPLREAVFPIMMQEPDRSKLTGTIEQISTVTEHMPGDVVTGYYDYVESLKKPLPFFLGDVESYDGKLLLSWDAAYDFNGELVKYRLQIADDIAFTSRSILFDEELFALEKEINKLPPGTYYYKVTAINESGYSRLSYDHIIRSGNFDGIRGFTIEKDGSVVMFSD